MNHSLLVVQTSLATHPVGGCAKNRAADGAHVRFSGGYVVKCNTSVAACIGGAQQSSAVYN